MPSVAAELERSFDLALHDSDWPPDRRRAGCRGRRQGRAARHVERHGRRTSCSTPPDRSSESSPTTPSGSTTSISMRRRDRGVLVSNTPGVLTRATAEFTIALMLDLLRRVTEGDRLVRSGTPWILAPGFMLGRGLEGRTLGIVGLGRIGREVARLAEAFGMRVVYASRSAVAEVSYRPPAAGGAAGERATSSASTARSRRRRGI